MPKLFVNLSSETKSVCDCKVDFYFMCKMKLLPVLIAVALIAVNIFLLTVDSIIAFSQEFANQN